jgi:hypothetical protein
VTEAVVGEVEDMLAAKGDLRPLVREVQAALQPS